MLLQVILFCCRNELEMTYHVNNKYSHSTNDFTLVTPINKNYTEHSNGNKDITDKLNHTPTYDVLSSYSKWLSDCRIISGSLLQLQETIGQGIVNSYI